MKLEILVILSLCCLALTLKDDDEGRPYEFGFTIDGQQHRHESKDVNGIVNGEFGFITADGIYHVTVYATDENGNFKILSMRNVRVSGPLDEPGYEFPKKTPTSSNPQTHEKLIAEVPTTTTTTTEVPTTNNAPYKFTTLPSLNVPACGSCKLPSTTPRPLGQNPGEKPKLQFQTPEFQAPGAQKAPPQPPALQKPAFHGSTFQEKQPNFQKEQPEFQQRQPDFQKEQPEFQQRQPEATTDPSLPNFGTEELIDKRYGNGPVEDFSGTLPDNYEPVKPSIDYQPPHFENDITNTRTGKKIGTPEKLQDLPPPPRSNSPLQQVTVSDRLINIPGREPIPIKDPYPNMVNGLPSGITENDMLDLLYKFNYTLGFHGHHEKGLKNGAKVGAYFVNGRDGISRVVEYIADENGYRPKVKFINLGYDHPDTPKEETEKSFGLKGYEFTWYPI